MVAIIQAAVAAAIGCDHDDVLPVFGDTARAPDSGSTTASRGTYVVWKAAALMGPDFSRQLRSTAGRALNRLPDELIVAPGGLRDARTNSGELVISFAALSEKLATDTRPHAACAFEFPKTDWQTSNARFIFAFGAALARVAVDRTTGEVRVLDLEQHTAAGPVLDPAGYLGQLEGGGVQGLGFTLTEDMIATKASCRIGRCGSCLVLLNGNAVNSCLLMAWQLEGAEIISPEALDALPEGRVVREALVAEVAFQCGYCAPGFAVALTALLLQERNADDAAIRAALEGNICRCTGYSSILRGAILARQLLSARRRYLA